MRARACSSSWGGRETRAFYFSVCVLSVVSASSGTRTAQEWRGRKQKTQRQIRTIFLRKSRKRRSENSEKPSQIGKKSMKNRSWLVFGVQSRSGGASERVRDGPGVAKAGPGAILGRPGRAKSGRETPLPGPSRATSECVRRDNHSQTRHRNDFSSILFCRAKALMC